MKTNALPPPISIPKPTLKAITFKVDDVEFTYCITNRCLDFGRNYSTMSFHTFTKCVDYVNAFLKLNNP